MNGLLAKCGIGCGLVVLSIWGTATVLSQPDPATMPEMTKEQLAAMQRWMEYMTPGEHHKELSKCVGKWDLEMKYWMDPNADPQVNHAKSEAKLIMGGRYLLEEVEGMISMGGPAMSPFEGMSLTGYDNHANEFVTLWIDNFGTGFWMERGGEGPDDSLMMTRGKNYDAMSDQMMHTRTKVSIIDDDTRLIEFYAGPTKEEMFKGMEIRYTRR